MDLSHTPAGRPPPGVRPNFVNPESLRSPVIAVNVIFLVLATLAVVIRVYTKQRIARAIGWDDHVCVLALLGSATHSGLSFFAVNHEYGKHLWDIPAIRLTPKIGHAYGAISLSYGPTIFLTKLSLLLLYYRLFGVNDTMRYLIYFGIAFQALFYLTSVGFYSAEEAICVSAANLQTKFCLRTWIFTMIQAAVNIVTDFYVLILPVAMVSRLQLTRSRKIGVIAIFLTGLLATVVSLARLIVSARDIHNPDTLWNGATTAMMSAVEMNVGIICGCLPALPSFFKKHKPSLYYLGSLRARIFGGSTTNNSDPESTSKKAFRNKSFHGISLKMTSPSMNLKTEDYVELEEVSKDKPLGTRGK